MKNKFRFHLLGLVHLPTSKKYNSCAFTQKNIKLAKMLLDLGHDVFVYGAEGSTIVEDIGPNIKGKLTFVQTHSLEDIRKAWGDGDNRFEIGYDWHAGQFRHDINGDPTEATIKYYANTIKYINENKKDDDFLLITQGTYQKPIDKAVNLRLTCETGIGYRGSYATYRAFESSYIQYFTYGSEHPRQSINGSFYDRVIPNYFDAEDFPFEENKLNYYLFMGRLIKRKGLDIAIKTVEAVKGKLLVAGQPDSETTELMKNPRVMYVGFADAERRAKLLGGAKAVFTPSTYLEPFCGVFAEANLCGTPVITTNFGAFTDYVIDGLNGYKCNTLQDFVDAAKKIEGMDYKKIREYANKFTMDEVKKLYQKWFVDLHRVYDSFVDPKKKGWHYLDSH